MGNQEGNLSRFQVGGGRLLKEPMLGTQAPDTIRRKRDTFAFFSVFLLDFKADDAGDAGSASPASSALRGIVAEFTDGNHKTVLANRIDWSVSDRSRSLTFLRRRILRR